MLNNQNVLKRFNFNRGFLKMDPLRSTRNSEIYADSILEMGVTGTKWLVYRDVPELIKKYCNGTIALDYGCGPGISTSFLKRCGLTVDGVDIDEDMIKHAKELDPNGRYNIIKSGEILSKDNHYDIVFCLIVLVFISTKEELKKIIGEVTRVLKKGGIFMVTVTTEHSFNFDWYSVDIDFEENKNLTSGSPALARWKDNNLLFHCYNWTEDDIKCVLHDAGLNLICIHEPLGKVNEPYRWVSEYNKSIMKLYVARKDSV